MIENDYILKKYLETSSVRLMPSKFIGIESKIS